MSATDGNIQSLESALMNILYVGPRRMYGAPRQYSDTEDARPMNQLESAESSGSEEETTTNTETTQPIGGDTGGDSPPVNLVLRIRNAKRELNDIRFDYAVGKDSADGIAAELVGAGLVDGKDIVVMAANLQKLIEQREQMKTVTFQLNSALSSGEIADDKALTGFAQISITD